MGGEVAVVVLLVAVIVETIVAAVSVSASVV